EVIRTRMFQRGVTLKRELVVRVVDIWNEVVETGPADGFKIGQPDSLVAGYAVFEVHAGQDIGIMNGKASFICGRRHVRQLVDLGIFDAYTAQHLEGFEHREFGLDIAGTHLFVCRVVVEIYCRSDSLALTQGLEVERYIPDIGSGDGLVGNIRLHGVIVVVVVPGLIAIHSTGGQFYVVTEDRGLIGQVGIAGEVLVFIVLPAMGHDVRGPVRDRIGGAVDVTFNIADDKLIPFIRGLVG